ncbi:hypothetical protein LZ30DRAFT_706266 [Colletotrichum cereale]|nr:hypothetical protein LZ30DRAFT_706266 [Colletotrichum cereale]
MKVIKNGIAKQPTTAKVANAAAGPSPMAASGTDGFTFPPSLHNPGDRGYNWTERTSTHHLIEDEFSDHYGHTCRPFWHKTRPYAGAQ